MKIAAGFLCLFALVGQSVLAGDAFERHTAYWLKQAAREGKPLEELSMQQARRLKSIGKNIDGACVVIKTGKQNWTKALLTWGFLKGSEGPVPVVLIERFVTYRGDRDNVTTATGKDVMLFAGFGFDFDLGQVVPAGLGEDVGVTEAGALAPRAGAELFGLNGSQLPPPTEADEYDPTDHPEVRPRDFAGTWKVDVDGRWRGEWSLRVEDDGRVRGTLTSAESRSNYPIAGRVSLPPHRLKLTVHFENAEQTIDGYLWTKDKSAIAGTATLADRKFGFHAQRVIAVKPDSERPARRPAE